jgi:hypothetical protein
MERSVSLGERSRDQKGADVWERIFNHGVHGEHGVLHLNRSGRGERTGIMEVGEDTALYFEHEGREGREKLINGLNQNHDIL